MADGPLDRIHLRNLQLRCVIGVYPKERRAKRRVIVNATLYTDLSRAGQTDDLADTVNYAALKNEIVARVEGSSFALLERRAAGIAQICLTPPTVRKVGVSVEKLGALGLDRSAIIEIERER